ncbi:MAG: GNAT family N-acetyltransferase [Deltaproteobacteria bacterium]|nr:GNAT family N-acetyltransferase [Deltaproteobacteria bacterium]MBW2113104.1 GNAT family N-acetyltransferase [Deltaproteobacteria bacterium]
MKITSQIVDPTRYPGWDELILLNPEYSFFHSSAWAKTLSESYAYIPVFFTIFQNKAPVSIIPLMEVKSILTGRRGVSLPFSDYCPPIIREKGHFEIVLDDMVKYGTKNGWKYLELRGGHEFLGNFSPANRFYRHVLDLERDSDTIFHAFKGSTRRNIRKALKENLRVSISHSLTSVMEFYRLNSITRKDHGLPPQPRSFFENVHNYIISKGKGIVVLASFRGRNIAGAIFFHFGRRAIYKYGASERAFQSKRPNNLVMWEAIKWYSERGFESISFGRTEPENTGLLQFKRAWGTREEVLRYYRYDFRARSFVVNIPQTQAFAPIFRRMPIPLLNLLGSFLYRHVG